MTENHRIFLGVDLLKWVYGAIDKHQNGSSWNDAWFRAYQEVGGRTANSGHKGCPRSAARMLYEYGRLKNVEKPFKDSPTLDLWSVSKNGTYAILAIRILSRNPTFDKTELWREIQRTVRNEVGEKPAGSDQGGPTLTFKLWHLQQIRIDGN